MPRISQDPYSIKDPISSGKKDLEQYVEELTRRKLTGEDGIFPLPQTAFEARKYAVESADDVLRFAEKSSLLSVHGRLLDAIIGEFNKKKYADHISEQYSNASLHCSSAKIDRAIKTAESSVQQVTEETRRSMASAQAGFSRMRSKISKKSATVTDHKGYNSLGKEFFKGLIESCKSEAISKIQDINRSSQKSLNKLKDHFKQKSADGKSEESFDNYVCNVQSEAVEQMYGLLIKLIDYSEEIYEDEEKRDGGCKSFAIQILRMAKGSEFDYISELAMPEKILNSCYEDKTGLLPVLVVSASIIYTIEQAAISGGYSLSKKFVSEMASSKELVIDDAIEIGKFILEPTIEPFIRILTHISNSGKLIKFFNEIGRKDPMFEKSILNLHDKLKHDQSTIYTQNLYTTIGNISVLWETMNGSKECLLSSIRENLKTLGHELISKSTKFIERHIVLPPNSVKVILTKINEVLSDHLERIQRHTSEIYSPLVLSRFNARKFLTGGENKTLQAEVAILENISRASTVNSLGKVVSTIQNSKADLNRFEAETKFRSTILKTSLRGGLASFSATMEKVQDIIENNASIYTSYAQSVQKVIKDFHEEVAATIYQMCGMLVVANHMKDLVEYVVNGHIGIGPTIGINKYSARSEIINIDKTREIVASICTDFMPDIMRDMSEEAIQQEIIQKRNILIDSKNDLTNKHIGALKVILELRLGTKENRVLDVGASDYAINELRSESNADENSVRAFSEFSKGVNSLRKSDDFINFLLPRVERYKATSESENNSCSNSDSSKKERAWQLPRIFCPQISINDRIEMIKALANLIDSDPEVSRRAGFANSLSSDLIKYFNAGNLTSNDDSNRTCLLDILLGTSVLSDEDEEPDHHSVRMDISLNCAQLNTAIETIQNSDKKKADKRNAEKSKNDDVGFINEIHDEIVKIVQFHDHVSEIVISNKLQIARDTENKSTQEDIILDSRFLTAQLKTYVETIDKDHEKVFFDTLSKVHTNLSAPSSEKSSTSKHEPSGILAAIMNAFVNNHASSSLPEDVAESCNKRLNSSLATVSAIISGGFFEKSYEVLEKARLFLYGLVKNEGMDTVDVSSRAAAKTLINSLSNFASGSSANVEYGFNQLLEIIPEKNYQIILDPLHKAQLGCVELCVHLYRLAKGVIDVKKKSAATINIDLNVYKKAKSLLVDYISYLEDVLKTQVASDEAEEKKRKEDYIEKINVSKNVLRNMESDVTPKDVLMSLCQDIVESEEIKQSARKFFSDIQRDADTIGMSLALEENHLCNQFIATIGSHTSLWLKLIENTMSRRRVTNVKSERVSILKAIIANNSHIGGYVSMPDVYQKTSELHDIVGSLLFAAVDESEFKLINSKLESGKKGFISPFRGSDALVEAITVDDATNEIFMFRDFVDDWMNNVKNLSSLSENILSNLTPFLNAYTTSTNVIGGKIREALNELKDAINFFETGSAMKAFTRDVNVRELSAEPKPDEELNGDDCLGNYKYEHRIPMSGIFFTECNKHFANIDRACELIENYRLPHQPHDLLYHIRDMIEKIRVSEDEKERADYLNEYNESINAYTSMLDPKSDKAREILGAMSKLKFIGTVDTANRGDRLERSSSLANAYASITSLIFARAIDESIKSGSMNPVKFAVAMEIKEGSWIKNRITGEFEKSPVIINSISKKYCERQIRAIYGYKLLDEEQSNLKNKAKIIPILSSILIDARSSAETLNTLKEDSKFRQGLINLMIRSNVEKNGSVFRISKTERNSPASVKGLSSLEVESTQLFHSENIVYDMLSTVEGAKSQNIETTIKLANSLHQALIAQINLFKKLLSNEPDVRDIMGADFSNILHKLNIKMIGDKESAFTTLWQTVSNTNCNNPSSSEKIILEPASFANCQSSLKMSEVLSIDNAKARNIFGKFGDAANTSDVYEYFRSATIIPNALKNVVKALGISTESSLATFRTALTTTGADKNSITEKLLSNDLAILSNMNLMHALKYYDSSAVSNDDLLNQGKVIKFDSLQSILGKLKPIPTVEELINIVQEGSLKSMILQFKESINSEDESNVTPEDMSNAFLAIKNDVYAKRVGQLAKALKLSTSALNALTKMSSEIDTNERQIDVSSIASFLRSLTSLPEFKMIEKMICALPSFLIDLKRYDLEIDRLKDELDEVAQSNNIADAEKSEKMNQLNKEIAKFNQKNKEIFDDSPKDAENMLKDIQSFSVNFSEDKYSGGTNAKIEDIKSAVDAAMAVISIINGSVRVGIYKMLDICNYATEINKQYFSEKDPVGNAAYFDTKEILSTNIILEKIVNLTDDICAKNNLFPESTCENVIKNAKEYFRDDAGNDIQTTALYLLYPGPTNEINDTIARVAQNVGISDLKDANDVISFFNNNLKKKTGIEKDMMILFDINESTQSNRGNEAGEGTIEEAFESYMENNLDNQWLSVDVLKSIEEFKKQTIEPKIVNLLRTFNSVKDYLVHLQNTNQWHSVTANNFVQIIDDIRSIFTTMNPTPLQEIGIISLSVSRILPQISAFAANVLASGDSLVFIRKEDQEPTQQSEEVESRPIDMCAEIVRIISQHKNSVFSVVDSNETMPWKAWRSNVGVDDIIEVSRPSGNKTKFSASIQELLNSVRDDQNEFNEMDIERINRAGILINKVLAQVFDVSEEIVQQSKDANILEKLEAQNNSLGDILIGDESFVAANSLFNVRRLLESINGQNTEFRSSSETRNKIEEIKQKIDSEQNSLKNLSRNLYKELLSPLKALTDATVLLQNSAKCDVKINAESFFGTVPANSTLPIVIEEQTELIKDHLICSIQCEDTDEDLLDRLVNDFVRIIFALTNNKDLLNEVDRILSFDLLISQEQINSDPAMKILNNICSNITDIFYALTDTQHKVCASNFIKNMLSCYKKRIESLNIDYPKTAPSGSQYDELQNAIDQLRAAEDNFESENERVNDQTEKVRQLIADYENLKKTEEEAAQANNQSLCNLMQKIRDLKPNNSAEENQQISEISDTSINETIESLKAIIVEVENSVPASAEGEAAAEGDEATSNIADRLQSLKELETQFTNVIALCRDTEASSDSKIRDATLALEQQQELFKEVSAMAAAANEAMLEARHRLDAATQNCNTNAGNTNADIEAKWAKVKNAISQMIDDRFSAPIKSCVKIETLNNSLNDALAEKARVAQTQKYETFSDELAKECLPHISPAIAALCHIYKSATDQKIKLIASSKTESLRRVFDIGSNALKLAGILSTFVSEYEASLTIGLLNQLHSMQSSRESQLALARKYIKTLPSGIAKIVSDCQITPEVEDAIEKAIAESEQYSDNEEEKLDIDHLPTNLRKFIRSKNGLREYEDLTRISAEGLKMHEGLASGEITNINGFSHSELIELQIVQIIENESRKELTRLSMVQSSARQESAEMDYRINAVKNSFFNEFITVFSAFLTEKYCALCEAHAALLIRRVLTENREKLIDQGCLLSMFNSALDAQFAENTSLKRKLSDSANITMRALFCVEIKHFNVDADRMPSETEDSRPRGVSESPPRLDYSNVDQSQEMLQYPKIESKKAPEGALGFDYGDMARASAFYDKNRSKPCSNESFYERINDENIENTSPKIRYNESEYMEPHHYERRYESLSKMSRKDLIEKLDSLTSKNNPELASFSTLPETFESIKEYLSSLPIILGSIRQMLPDAKASLSDKPLEFKDVNDLLFNKMTNIDEVVEILTLLREQKKSKDPLTKKDVSSNKNKEDTVERMRQFSKQEKGRSDMASSIAHIDVSPCKPESDNEKTTDNDVVDVANMADVFSAISNVARLLYHTKEIKLTTQKILSQPFVDGASSYASRSEQIIRIYMQNFLDRISNNAEECHAFALSLMNSRPFDQVYRLPSSISPTSDSKLAKATSFARVLTSIESEGGYLRNNPAVTNLDSHLDAVTSIEKCKERIKTISIPIVDESIAESRKLFEIAERYGLNSEMEIQYLSIEELKMLSQKRLTSEGKESTLNAAAHAARSSIQSNVELGGIASESAASIEKSRAVSEKSDSTMSDCKALRNIASGINSISEPFSSEEVSSRIETLKIENPARASAASTIVGNSSSEAHDSGQRLRTTSSRRRDRDDERVKSKDEASVSSVFPVKATAKYAGTRGGRTEASGTRSNAGSMRSIYSNPPLDASQPNDDGTLSGAPVTDYIGSLGAATATFEAAKTIAPKLKRKKEEGDAVPTLSLGTRINTKDNQSVAPSRRDGGGGSRIGSASGSKSGSQLHLAKITDSNALAEAVLNESDSVLAAGRRSSRKN